MNEIIVEHKDSVTTLTIHREQAGNMFDLPMIHEMTRQLGLAGSQGHCVVIRGSGPNFCRGRDPSTAGPQPSPIDLRDRVLSPIMGLYDAIRYSRVPVIAAVQGDAVLVFSNYLLASRAAPVLPAHVPAQRTDDFFAFALANYPYAVHPSAVMIERAALRRAGLFPLGATMGGDTDTFCRLALEGAFRYVAEPTAVYRDGHPTSVLAHQLRKRPLPPPFDRTLTALLRHGAVPSRLVRSAGRYRNFLMLEYARQLLDFGDPEAARDILRRHCRLADDPVRYAKRFLRTWSFGHRLYALSRQVVPQR